MLTDQYNEQKGASWNNIAATAAGSIAFATSAATTTAAGTSALAAGHSIHTALVFIQMTTQLIAQETCTLRPH